MVTSENSYDSEGGSERSEILLLSTIYMLNICDLYQFVLNGNRIWFNWEGNVCIFDSG